MFGLGMSRPSGNDKGNRDGSRLSSVAARGFINQYFKYDSELIHENKN